MAMEELVTRRIRCPARLQLAGVLFLAVAVAGVLFMSSSPSYISLWFYNNINNSNNINNNSSSNNNIINDHNNNISVVKWSEVVVAPAPATSPAAGNDDQFQSAIDSTPIIKAPTASPVIENGSDDSDQPEQRVDPPQASPSLTSIKWELMNAKKELINSNSPPLVNDPLLHPPLFLNVSTFMRSYNSMENIMKVYIYEEGDVPLVHTPELSGIYASEGWFMKLMEASQHFVAKDPNKAHLFYLPYSSRKLREYLYVPDSHDMGPLSRFIRDYVNMLSVKYPFWNNTKGVDHFFVACHDWAPYTTRLHKELEKNSIKVLCNADSSEGIFVRGKDVSLPETYIRDPQRPNQGLGGKSHSKRSILAFFAGRLHGPVRPILLQHWRGKDNDIRIYEVLPDNIAKKMSYIQHMKRSKFCICPMGYEVNSPRIVEALYYECVPVIIADNFVFPFEEVLNWSVFSIVVAEKDIPNLKNILLGVSDRDYANLQTNVKKVQKHFVWNPEPKKYDLFHMILHSVWLSRLSQIQVQ